MGKKRWVILKEYGGAYKISDTGEIWSIDRLDMSGKKRTSKQIRLRISKKYYCGNIRINGCSKTVRPHRIVALHFVPNPENKPLVNHLDGNTLNNAYWNLEWTDHIGNTIHAIRNRLTRKPGGKEKTLTETQVLKIFKSKNTTEKLSRKYTVCLGTINSIRNGRKWSWLTGKKYVPKDGNRKYVEYNGDKITYGDLAKKLKITRGAVTYKIKQNQFKKLY